MDPFTKGKHLALMGHLALLGVILVAIAIASWNEKHQKTGGDFYDGGDFRCRARRREKYRRQCRGRTGPEPETPPEPAAPEKEAEPTPSPIPAPAALPKSSSPNPFPSQPSQADPQTKTQSNPCGQAQFLCRLSKVQSHGQTAWDKIVEKDIGQVPFASANPFRPELWRSAFGGP
jgi:hypothetical protein